MSSSNNVHSGRPNLKLINRKSVTAKLGVCNSALYANIAKGLWTKAVKSGPRGSRWPEHEADAIIAARIAGKPDDEIRALVQSLHAKRQDDYAALTGASA